MNLWDSTTRLLLVAIVLILLNQATVLTMQKFTEQNSPDFTDSSTEGFENLGASKGSKRLTKAEAKEENSLQTWQKDPESIYDEFQSGVYDTISGQADRTRAKVALIVDRWKKTSPNARTWSVLDAACGTGIATAEFAKADVPQVVGLDLSRPMLNIGETKNTNAAKLTPEQKKAIVWRRDTLVNPSACSAGEFSHIVLLYFSLYQMQDQEQLFRQLQFWSRPKAQMCVEVVNKQKFDPILEPASPFLGFSLQKQAEKRIRKSKIAFDKFDQEAEFMLSDPKAEFQETFVFKNGDATRRQKHVMWMPKIKQVVEMAARAQWKQTNFIDLNPLGFEQGYLLFFEK